MLGPRGNQDEHEANKATEQLSLSLGDYPLDNHGRDRGRAPPSARVRRPGYCLWFLGSNLLRSAARRGAIRENTRLIQHHGLSLGGLVELTPLRLTRLSREFGRAVLWALACSVVIFPPFWVGYLAWHRPTSAFVWNWPAAPLDQVLAQLILVALPEEAFFRGYLQTRLDDIWPARWTILGGRIGLGLVATSTIFALGHLTTHFHVSRLSVFFPALLFGWLRNRTGGIGASLCFHALCNLFASFLARGYASP